MPVTRQQQSSGYPTRPAAKWEKDNDVKLIEARRHGMNWQAIADEHFPGQSANACRKRHERLMRDQKREAWDGPKLDLLASEYAAVRREMWTILASRLNEKWEIIEAKCMEKGLKQLTTHARSYERTHRASRVSDPSSWDAGYHVGAVGGYPGTPTVNHTTYADHDDDSGIALEDAENVAGTTSLDDETTDLPPHHHNNNHHSSHLHSLHPRYHTHIQQQQYTHHHHHHPAPLDPTTAHPHTNSDSNSSNPSITSTRTPSLHNSSRNPMRDDRRHQQHQHLGSSTSGSSAGSSSGRSHRRTASSSSSSIAAAHAAATVAAMGYVPQSQPHTYAPYAEYPDPPSSGPVQGYFVSGMPVGDNGGYDTRMGALSGYDASQAAADYGLPRIEIYEVPQGVSAMAQSAHRPHGMGSASRGSRMR